MASAAFTGGAAVTYDEGATFDYVTTGKYLENHAIGTPEYDRVFEPTPGVDGQGCKLMGFRQRKIKLEVLYINTNENTVIAAAAADQALLAAQTQGSTLALAGLTFYGVYLEEFTLGQPKANGLTTARVWCRAQLLVSAKRLA